MRLTRRSDELLEARSSTLAGGPLRLPVEAPGPTTLLGDLLLERRAVTPRQLTEALLQQDVSGKRIGMLLVELGALAEETLTAVLAEQLDLPVVDLREATSHDDALAVLPETIARSHQAIPLWFTDGSLVIAVAEPSPELSRLLAAACGSPVSLVLTPGRDIRRAIDASYRALTAVTRQVQAFQATDTLRQAASGLRTQARGEAEDDAPVVQIVNLLITQGLRDGASDVHIEPQDERVRVRYRVDGALHDVLALPVTMGPALSSRIKIMAGLNIVERRKAQDGQIALDVEGRSVDIRVSTSATISGEKVVLRLLDKSRSLLRLTDLGMTPATVSTYGQLIRAPFGMVVCAGPTGSGKTTTLYASLTDINSPDRNITTIEDPVEYVFPSINQIQVNDQVGVDFAQALRTTMRQDPDIILVGEIRDPETARIAVQAALTGHLVLSSLHATDAVSALYRLLDMGVEDFLVASSISGVVAQRLVRKICDRCREPYKPTPEQLAFYKTIGGTTLRSGFWEGVGCNFCNHTGYSGRQGVYELLRVTPEMRELIVAQPTSAALRALATEQGMRSLRQEAIRLITSETTSIAEVLRSIYVLGA